MRKTTSDEGEGDSVSVSVRREEGVEIDDDR
jgi:hypothetical protein